MEILVVEDDSRMAALLRRGLEGAGHRVFVAADGREGLEYAGGLAHRPSEPAAGAPTQPVPSQAPNTATAEVTRRRRARGSPRRRE